MKLKDTCMQTNEEKPITFGHIRSGEVFLFDNTVLMKFEYEVSIDHAEFYNAVFLTNGSLAYFDADERVQRFIVAPELIYDSNKTISFCPKN